MSALEIALWAAVLVALLITTAQVALVLRLGRRGKARLALPASRPRVSILKPMSGLEDGLAENLASFARLEGVDYEVVVSVESPDDPALAVVEGVRREHPEAPFVVVTGAAGPAWNPKVARLLVAARHAAGDILLVSDSNVRVRPDDVARTVAPFDDPRVGLVSNPFVAPSPRTLGARVEALHLLTFVLPGCAIAAAADRVCVVGKSMAISRRALESVGGFAPFADLLAEDQSIGLAVQAAGFAVVLSPVVVANVVETRSLRAALSRQVRWGQMRHAFSRVTFASEILMNPLALAGLAFLASPSTSSAALLVLVLGLRLAQAVALCSATGVRFGAGLAAALPLKDLLQVGTLLVPFFDDEVSWRGHRARIGAGTLLKPLVAPGDSRKRSSAAWTAGAPAAEATRVAS